MNKRGPFIMWLFTISLISLSACVKQSAPDNDSGYGEDAIRLEQALACSNTYVGVSFTVPKGWWLHDLNTANFSPDPDDTADAAAFDIIYDENSLRMELISFANLRSLHQNKYNQNKYLGFEMNAEYSQEYSEETLNRADYWGHFAEFIPINPRDALISSGIITIGSASFEKHIYEAAPPLNDLRIITLGTLLKTGYFLNISAVYWGKNKNAETLIIELISNALALD